MSGVRYSDKAQRDIAEIAKYIARDKPVAARDWAARIRKTCRLLGTRPGMGELRTDLEPFDCRCFSVGAYVIFFRPKEGGIEVVRILHGAQDIRRL